MEPLHLEMDVTDRDCYIAREGSCWVRVGAIVLYIQGRGEEVKIEAFREGDESGEPYSQIVIF